MVKNPPANAGYIRSLRFDPWGGDGNPLQYLAWENLMDRGAWWATVLGVTNSQT